ncbi:hypothetical protein CBR_g28731 [Chara braunii]|uniref:HAT C-terminal dimerisation domain-containing protein n=1 Tax=Chara braunii TaxID=69332 RepID=A0A388L9Q5_CHABU|nr:hypothetical protein CBR_g28731 [Chara braunii]|eukprot:GBG79018.1 hypothetical protein CBR_g28731 [Chara braunii]
MIVRCLSACAVLEKDEQDAMLEVFDRRRTMFKSPAHVAAMMLDPEFQERTMPDDEEMQHGLKLALIQFGYPEHSDQHNEVLTAIDKFHSREPPFDDVAVDRAARSYTHPACFWESKEKRFPHTAFFAGRILRVWAIASPCETAWSRWSFIHSKSRNRLEVARVEEEVLTDQQLVSDRGARVTVMQEELMHARERMSVVSRMRATRRLRESDRRRCRGGGRGGGRRGGRGQGGRGGPGGRRSVTSHGRTAYELVHKPRQRWDEGDFLYESSSSDGEDFFGTGRPAQDGDNDFDDRHPDVDGDGGVGRDGRGGGGDRPRPCGGGRDRPRDRRDADRGPDEGARHCRDDGDADARSSAGASRPANGDTMCGDGAGGEHHTTPDDARDGADDDGSRLVPGGDLRRFKRGPRERDTIASRVRKRREEGSTDGPVDAVEREARPPRPSSNSEHHPITTGAGAVRGIPATDTTDATQQPVLGSSPTARRDRATVSPTVAFYASGSSTGGLDKQGFRIVGRPSAPSMGTQSIGSVDGARHTATTEFEDRHGSALPTKTSDVHATRATKASLSLPRKKASTRKASCSLLHMRSHIGRSCVVHLEDGEIVPNDDALDVRGRAATTADNVARECSGDEVAGQKRRGSVLIVQDDSTDVVP